MRGFVVDWGKVDMQLKEFMLEHGISKNMLCNSANLQYSQLQAYYENTVSRPDLDVLARICYVLECRIEDILIYHEPKIINTTDLLLD